MTTATIGELVDRHGFDVLEHLDKDVTVPVVDGLQVQGDLAIIPIAGTTPRGKPVNPDDAAVVPGEAGAGEVGAAQPGAVLTGAPGRARLTGNAARLQSRHRGAVEPLPQLVTIRRI